MDKCPKCGEWLETVQVTKVVVAEWNYDEENPSYEDNGQGSVTVTCRKCGKQIAYYDANQRDTDALPVGLEDVL